MLTPAQKATLEQFIDNDDLHSVLEEIAEICSAKSDHVRASYGDHKTASAWNRAAVAILRAQGDPFVKAVSARR